MTQISPSDLPKRSTYPSTDTTLPFDTEYSEISRAASKFSNSTNHSYSEVLNHVRKKFEQRSKTISYDSSVNDEDASAGSATSRMSVNSDSNSASYDCSTKTVKLNPKLPENLNPRAIRSNSNASGYKNTGYGLSDASKRLSQNHRSNSSQYFTGLQNDF